MNVKSIGLISLIVLIASCSSNSTSTLPIGQTKLLRSQISNQGDNVHCGLLDKDGNLWFGTTRDGVYKYDGTLFVNYTTGNTGLTNNSIWSILEDRNGNIWFGTDSGISRFDGKRIVGIPINIAGEHAPSVKNAVWSILEDTRGILWFGTTDGVYCYDGTSFSYFLDDPTIVNSKGLHLKVIEDLLEDRDGNIWFASWGREGMCRFDGRTLTNIFPAGELMFKRILQDKKGNFWFASRPNKVLYYDGTETINYTEKEGLRGVTEMITDHAGNIWFTGDQKGALWRYDGAVLTRIADEDLGKDGLWCIVEDREGNMWIGTRNTGLYRYDGKTFTSFSATKSEMCKK